MVKEVILITGSRSITDRNKVFEALDKQVDPAGVYVLIQGEAPGVDILSREWCESRGVNCMGMPIPDDYRNAYGNGAGNMRNKDMLEKALEISARESIPVRGIAFWDGSSTGTQDMINRMHKTTVLVYVTLMGKPKTKRLI